MTTQVFFRTPSAEACDQWGPGIAAWNPNTAYYSTGMTAVSLGSCRLSRGGSLLGIDSGATTVASSTARHRVLSAANTPRQWITPPIDRDVTIASTVTFNLWWWESSMSANVQAGCRVERILGDGSLSATAVVAGATEGVEMNTAARAENFTATPTSTAFNKGDRLLITPYWTNSGTQAAGFNTTFDYEGATAGADGDSYVTFTEDFGFLTVAPGTNPLANASSNNGANLGNVSANTRLAFPIRLDWATTLTQITLTMGKVGSPVDNVEAALQADSSGAPSGTDLASASVVGSTLSGAGNLDVVFNIADTALTVATTYWIVIRRTTAVDAVNYYSLSGLSGGPAWTGVGLYIYNGSVWARGFDIGPVASLDFTSVPATTLYPTGTASDIDPGGGGTDTKEAWTSRGAGATNAITNAAAGPHAPIQITVTAGGNLAEWYSKPLTAFTLGGAVLVVNRHKGSIGGNGVNIKTELAICNADGSGATVWGTAMNGDLDSATETAYSAFIAGDDTAVADGKRLRLRFYVDDANSANDFGGQTLTLIYAGTSGGASGDTYLTFGQTLTEFVTAAADIPALVMAPRSN